MPVRGRRIGGWLVAAAAACAAAGAPVAAAAQPIDRELQMRLAPSVVKVEAVSEEGTFSLGSGVVVAPQRVVTNCHVTRRARSIRVVRGALRHEATAQRSDMERDLCLLIVPDVPTAPATLVDDAAVRPRQRVVGVGFTGGVGRRFSLGEIIALHRHAGGQVIQATSGFTSGASGGGLFNTAGALIGVLTYRLRGGEVHYFSAPVAWVRDLLNHSEESSEIAPIAGLAYWEREGAAQPPFLVAATLALQQRWTELRLMAITWSRDDPDDPEAWQQLAMACHHLGRSVQAREAMEQLRQRDAALAREMQEQMTR